MEKVSVYTGPPLAAIGAANFAILDRKHHGFEAGRIEFATDNVLLTIGIKWRTAANPRVRTVVGTDQKDFWGGAAANNHPILWIGGTYWFFGVE